LRATLISPSTNRFPNLACSSEDLHLIGCARAAVTPEVSYAQKVLIPTTNVFDRPEARAKQKQKKSRPTAATVLGKAIKVDNEKKVVTVQKADETTEDLKYTYLVSTYVE